MNRTGEDGSTPSRVARLFEENNYWYYSTREGVTIGPFDTRQEAESGVRHFVDYITHASKRAAQSFARYKTSEHSAENI